MAIEKRGAQWYFRFQFRGREHRRPTGLDATASNLKKAEEMEADLRASLKRGPHSPVRKIGFEAAVKEFLKWCETTEYRGRKTTVDRIRTSMASQIAFFQSFYVCDITPEFVEAYKSWRIEEHAVRDSTLRNDLINLGLFFRRYAIKFRIADSNPVTEVSKPSVAHAMRIHVISDEEERKYFPAALAESKSLHDLAKLILLTGARPDEMLTSRREHFNSRNRTLFIPGGKTPAARRVLHLTDEAHSILLWRSRQVSAWLFPSPLTWRKDKPLTKLNNQHDAACRRGAVSFCLYDLRHTFATRMVETGVEIPTLAAILGHSGLTMVMRYVHPTDASQRAAMAKYQAKISDQSRTSKEDAAEGG